MATLSVRLDDKTKDDFSKFCDTVGMSVSSLFAVFAKTVVREQRIPFEISAKSAPPAGQKTPLVCYNKIAPPEAELSQMTSAYSLIVI